jgi:probable selenium-dependent hydroxylase accessory protein YqeC
MPSRPAGLRLWRALNLGDVTQGGPAVVAIVGGGGKTSLAYRLAYEAAQMGRRAVVTGTTRFTRGRPMPPLIQSDPARLPRHILEAWARNPGETQALAVAAEGEAENGRLLPLPEPAIEEIARLPGLALLIVNADGSRMKPFKAPGPDEPAIPAVATHVVAVVGVSALDRPLTEEWVHRPEQVQAIAPGAVCDAALIASVAASEHGSRKGVGARRFTVVVNQADLDEAGAHRLGLAIRAAGVPRVVVTSLHDDADPVREVLER